MQSSDAPGKVVLPFANDGSARVAIPVPSQVGITPGAASYTTGFPPLTRTPVASGGILPKGTEYNGILYVLSAINRWMQAGGPATYDSAFSTAIGGYPLGAVLKSNDGLTYYRSTVENNTSNPNTGGANWAIDLFNAVTAALGTNTTQIATTAFVQAAVTASTSAVMKKGTIHFGDIDPGVHDTGTLTFPTAFPTTCDQIFLQLEEVSGNLALIAEKTKSTTGFTYALREADSVIQDFYIHWLAFGS